VDGIDLLTDGVAVGERRQSPTMLASLMSCYGPLDSGPRPAMAVAIVLGSVAGFLLVVWLFLPCLTPQRWPSFGGIGRPGGRRGNKEEMVVLIRCDDSVFSAWASPEAATGAPRREGVESEEEFWGMKKSKKDKKDKKKKKIRSGSPVGLRIREVPRDVEAEDVEI